MSDLALVALVVRDYEPAIDFFVNVLSFELVEDTPSVTNDGRSKRWVVVRPRGGATGILLARADGAQQTGIVGKQFAVASDSCCEWMISRRTTNGWWKLALSSSQHPVLSRTGRSRYSWTSKGIVGTSSVLSSR